MNFKETKPQISSTNDQIISNLNTWLGSGFHNNDYIPGGLHNRNLFSHSSLGWKSEIKVWAGLVSFEASLLSLYMDFFFWCLHAVFSPLCVCALIASYKDTSYIRLEPTLMTSLNLKYPFKDPISRYSHLLRHWGLRLQNMNLVAGSNTVQPITLINTILNTKE